MSFNKNEWNNEELCELSTFLLRNKRSEKNILFEKKIVNTKLNCYAIKTDVINSIVKEILKGNYISFLNNCRIADYPTSIIYGKVLVSLTDFSTFIKFFEKYSFYIDCWAHCDIFKLKVKSLGVSNVKLFVNNCLKSCNEFIRRIGVIILLKNFISDNEIDFVFSTISKMNNEKKYYVNMAIAWLLCDCFIKQREKTLNFIKNNTVNNFVFNKFVSKCCDSFRVNNEDKQTLMLMKKEGL